MLYSSNHLSNVIGFFHSPSNRKKTLAVSLIAAAALSLGGCGGDSGDGTPGSVAANATQPGSSANPASGAAVSGASLRKVVDHRIVLQKAGAGD
jgi:hypothetical protein